MQTATWPFTTNKNIFFRSSCPLDQYATGNADVYHCLQEQEHKVQTGPRHIPASLLYEAVVPGMPAYQSLSGQLNDFPEMPSTEPGKAYHWAASANAALAEMSRRLFPTTADANKTAINNLENELKAGYANEADAVTLQRSIAFGKEVATSVANWAATDGSANVNHPYVLPPGSGLPPAGTGLWVPTSACLPL